MAGPQGGKFMRKHQLQRGKDRAERRKKQQTYIEAKVAQKAAKAANVSGAHVDQGGGGRTNLTSLKVDGESIRKRKRSENGEPGVENVNKENGASEAAHNQGLLSGPDSDRGSVPVKIGATGTPFTKKAKQMPGPKYKGGSRSGGNVAVVRKQKKPKDITISGGRISQNDDKLPETSRLNDLKSDGGEGVTRVQGRSEEGRFLPKQLQLCQVDGQESARAAATQEAGSVHEEATELVTRMDSPSKAPGPGQPDRGQAERVDIVGLARQLASRLAESKEGAAQQSCHSLRGGDGVSSEVKSRAPAGGGSNGTVGQVARGQAATVRSAAGVGEAELKGADPLAQGWRPDDAEALDDSSSEDEEAARRMAAILSVAVDSASIVRSAADLSQGGSKRKARRGQMSKKVSTRDKKRALDSLSDEDDGHGLDDGHQDLKLYQLKAQDLLHRHLDETFGASFSEDAADSKAEPKKLRKSANTTPTAVEKQKQKQNKSLHEEGGHPSAKKVNATPPAEQPASNSGPDNSARGAFDTEGSLLGSGAGGFTLLSRRFRSTGAAPPSSIGMGHSDLKDWRVHVEEGAAGEALVESKKSKRVQKELDKKKKIEEKEQKEREAKEMKKEMKRQKKGEGSRRVGTEMDVSAGAGKESKSQDDDGGEAGKCNGEGSKKRKKVTKGAR
eukprot:jgi/Mesen1/3244/ME000187S02410